MSVDYGRAQAEDILDFVSEGDGEHPDDILVDMYIYKYTHTYTYIHNIIFVCIHIYIYI